LTPARLAGSICYNSLNIDHILVSDMQKRCLITVLLTIIPGVALSQNVTNYQCTYGDLMRRVTIIYEPGRTVPCEVHYYKDTEAPGEPQVLWRAVNEAGYCEAKTEEFVAMLTESGWSCSDASAAVATPVEEPGELRDDSDALAPSGPEDAAEQQ